MLPLLYQTNAGTGYWTPTQMGLDMYLYKKTYVKQWDFHKDHERFNVTVERGGKPYTKIKPERISYVIETAMYWRKVNQIHGWFVNNTQSIEDDVKYYVTLSDLVKLRDVCAKVLDILNSSPKKTVQLQNGWVDGKENFEDGVIYDCGDQIKELLPPTQGFFFGHYDLDEWYYKGVEDTLIFLNNEITNSSEDDEFEYYASW